MLASKLKNIAIILNIVTISLIGAEKDYVDIMQAKETVNKIYKESNTDYLWLKERNCNDKVKMKNYYNNFFTDEFSNMIANYLCKGKNVEFFSISSDPRFPGERDNACREQVIKLRIHNPVKLDKISAIVRVDYKTNQTDGDTCVTVYFLKMQKKRWLIDDQDLGRSYTTHSIRNNTKFRPNLRMLMDGD